MIIRYDYYETCFLALSLSSLYSIVTLLNNLTCTERSNRVYRIFIDFFHLLKVFKKNLLIRLSLVTGVDSRSRKTKSIYIQMCEKLNTLVLIVIDLHLLFKERQKSIPLL